MSVQMNWLYVGGGTTLGKSGYGLGSVIDPYNPLYLPPYTMRFKFSESYDPTTVKSWPKGSWNQVSSSPNIWDYTKTASFDDWNWLFSSAFSNSPDTVEVLGANTRGVTRMNNLFGYCSKLKSVNAFNVSSVRTVDGMFQWCTNLIECSVMDTSSAVDMREMFWHCDNLKTVPLFPTDSATDVYRMFCACFSVESGAYDLYLQMSTQATPPAHEMCFYLCGRNTETGAADLAKIPSSWKYPYN